jgi:hypothetical protein
VCLGAGEGQVCEEERTAVSLGLEAIEPGSAQLGGKSSRGIALKVSSSAYSVI